MLRIVVLSLSRSFVLAALLVATASGAARAQIGSERYASIVVDAASGNVLFSANPDERRFPASLTKMMTMYMVFEAIRDRRLSLDTYVPVTAVAASMPPTKLGLVPGSLITVEQAILGLVTRSANDVACALGEMMGGDEDRFAQMMTVRARALGIANTQFRNASGLPDWDQFSSARDMAVLARHLVQDFPAYYHYFSTPSFRYGGRFIPNHQRLLQTYPGADGLKTGYIEASGYNVVTSAVRADTRLIGVVLGASSGGERDQHMAVLLDMGFERLGVAPALVARAPALHSPASSAQVAQAWASRREPPPRFALFPAAQAAPYVPRPARAAVIQAPPPAYHSAPAFAPTAPSRGRGAPQRVWAPGPPPVAARRPALNSRAERLPVIERPGRLPPPVMPAARSGSTRTAHGTPGRYPG